MELSKKTTILFPPDLHAHLVAVSERLGVSLGELVRRACEAQYGVVSPEQRLAAVRELAALRLPVSTPDRMKAESVPEPDDLLP